MLLLLFSDQWNISFSEKSFTQLIIFACLRSQNILQLNRDDCFDTDYFS